MAGPLTPIAPANTGGPERIGQRFFRLVIPLAVVVIVAAGIHQIPPRDRPLSAVLSFLFVVLVVSAKWGFQYSVFTSVISALAFCWLVPPVGSFNIRNLRDVFALVAFLVMGITTSHFSDRARKEALNANQRRAEAVVAQQRFSDLVNSVEGIVWEADANTFVFSFVNDQAERILGYPKQRWLDEPTFWKDHLHPEDREWAVQFWLQATADKRTHDFEYRMIAADGRVVWLRDIVSVMVENGRAIRLRGVMIDITERKRVDEARQELEEQWKAAFQSNPTMYFIVDTSGKIVSVNAFGAGQLGYTASELVGQPVSNVFYEPDRQAVQQHASECFAEPGRMKRWEARKICKDGTMLWVRETGNAVVLKERPVLLVVCENITEQKRAEEAARRSEHEIRDLIETIPIMVFSAGRDGTTHFVSRNWQDYAGMSLEQTKGASWGATVHPDDIDKHTARWRVSLATGKPFENEVRHRGANGEYRWFLVRAVALHDEQERILKWYGVLTDIEDRKRAEALLAGEKRILEMVAKGDSLAQILDTLCRLVEEQASGVLTSVLLIEGNRLRHGGAPSLPKAYTDAVDGLEIGPSVGSCGTAAYRKEQVIVQDLATDPLWKDYRHAALPHSLRACWSTPILSSQGEVIATFAMYYREPRSPSLRDQQIIEQITHLAGAAIERKLTQEALRRSEAYLAEAQRLTRTGSWAWNPRSNRMIYCSEEIYRIFALDPKEPTPSIEVFLERVHPEDRDRVREESIRGGGDKAEQTLEYRILLPDGTIKYVNSMRHPVLDGAGDVVEIIGTIVDVTMRKRAEAELERLRQLEADLARVNRVTTMGELTASLAHEINQPIAAAVTDANTAVRWLARSVPDIEEAREAAKRAAKDATRAAEIITRIRSLFSKGSSQRELIDLNDVIEEMISLLRSEAARYDVSIEKQLDPDLPGVMADRVQIQQVLMNLMLNSIDAMKGSDNLRKLKLASERDGTEEAVVSVSDTGIGVPKETGKIFHAFFTTKPHGTGMGLAISRTIIESHGGRLWTTSNSGKGAIFYFALPAVFEVK